MAADGNNPDGQLHILLREWRTAWRPGIGAIVGGSLGYSLWSAVSSLFVIPLQQEFGWSRGEIAAANYAGLITAFAAPVVGRIVDRLHAKPVLVTGLILVAAFYGMLALLTGYLPIYYLLYFLLNLFGMATTGITVTRIVAGYFNRSRGTALAIARSMLGISAALTPLLIHPAIERYGSAGGFLTLGALALFVALPLVAFLVPRYRAGGGEPIAGRGAPPSRMLALLSRSKVRIICLAAALNYAPVVAIVSQLQPIGIGRGLSEGVAAGAVGILGMAAATGAILSGVLVDRFWAPAVAFTLNLIAGLGCVFLVFAGHSISPTAFYLAVFLIGIGQGAEIDVVAYMIARYFGLADYSTIYGLSTTCIALATAIGTPLIGSAYDLFGGYDEAILCCAASFGLAAIAYLAMGRYPASPAED
ncbi:MFS transporter [Novosphingobium malaysiense]|uniref:MFS transporter n=1 Tax=Novosphingobium malaysiense TaxID=1348853 RepID=A0A0B1ZDQ6_9SPHN|nr:MFS transporter [Novosphingobium malaysiense]